VAISRMRERTSRSRFFGAMTWASIAFLPLSAAQTETSVSACADKAGRLIRLHPRGSSLAATIAPDRGGELVGLEFIRSGKHRPLLYRDLDFCERPGWEGKAPVLWPATGRNFAVDPSTLPKGAPTSDAFGWVWHGQRYPMPIHGFARSLPWSVTRQSESSVRVLLADNDRTRIAYPFGFRFEIQYSVSGDVLTVTHRVTAATDNGEPMPFSIGNHVTFDIGNVASAKDARLTSPATRQILTDAEGRPTGTVVDRPPLDHVRLATLGRQSALSLGGYAADTVSAKLEMADGVTILIRQPRVAYPDRDLIRFNIWGDVDEGFFAIEPWFGRQNSLASGEGVIWLAPGKTFEWRFIVSASDVASSAHHDDRSKASPRQTGW